MKRVCAYLALALGISGALEKRALSGQGETETPLFIAVDLMSERQPTKFSIAVGDLIVFHFFRGGRGDSPPQPGQEKAPEIQKPQAAAGRAEVHVRGDQGVLGEVSPIRFASFSAGELRLDYAGRKGTLVVARKAGKEFVHVTIRRRGRRLESKVFEITVLEKRPQEVPVAPPSVK